MQDSEAIAAASAQGEVYLIALTGLAALALCTLAALWAIWRDHRNSEDWQTDPEEDPAEEAPDSVDAPAPGPHFAAFAAAPPPPPPQQTQPPPPPPPPPPPEEQLSTEERLRRIAVLLDRAEKLTD